ncbi:hypothetical protein FA15DRAFT_149256 [Coprinopsis marcescibilis]|uniref:Uncharacterized protein n=1 Tax=Coprinopsis marcescibilis TaxID=230819 RepID=A0A5C3L545_COPMA|nr:hypothetical protein FA15DRAFT_149256 [Coprinopsis marcescibilis]
MIPYAHHHHHTSATCIYVHRLALLVEQKLPSYPCWVFPAGFRWSLHYFWAITGIIVIHSLVSSVCIHILVLLATLNLFFCLYSLSLVT